MSGIKPKHHHSDNDIIYTPELLAIKLISKIPNSLEDSWCDPCKGEGVFYNNFLTNNKDWFEISEDKDFLQCNKKYDWCVTNIPFSMPKEFIFKMAECSNKGFGILCLANSMTGTRLKKLEEMGFYIHSLDVVYVKDWGFGYRTDFYVFTKNKNEYFETTIVKKDVFKETSSNNSKELMEDG